METHPCVFPGDSENNEKTRQSSENKQTFELTTFKKQDTGKIEIVRKTRQSPEYIQNCVLIDGQITFALSDNNLENKYLPYLIPAHLVFKQFKK